MQCVISDNIIISFYTHDNLRYISVRWTALDIRAYNNGNNNQITNWKLTINYRLKLDYKHNNIYTTRTDIALNISNCWS